MANVFITGATGFMGRRLSEEPVCRGHTVRGLARNIESRQAARRVSGNPLDASTYRDAIAPADTFVHLVGVTPPSPAKAAQFRTIDLASAKEAIAAARGVVRHFLEALPSTRNSARRLGLVTITQMVQTMTLAVEQPASGVRVLETPQIRQGTL